MRGCWSSEECAGIVKGCWNSEEGAGIVRGAGVVWRLTSICSQERLLVIIGVNNQ